MNFHNLTESEKNIVFECLKASLHGPFFPDWEFQTLFGVERTVLNDIEEKWPEVDFNEQTVSLALNNAMGNLVGYPHGQEKSWEKYISVSPDAVLNLIKKIKSSDS
ncbi:MAG: hypothetical protein KZQ85_10855 [Candidatus Thiodiazotropha sp. (ex Myrtea sp. 'scaly one' KF741663)]|nr:hypothetical protein [Candidatus Thiodiazotropha sp. (ex Myrtea sp. 'scaly one' KF741663)]